MLTEERMPRGLEPIQAPSPDPGALRLRMEDEAGVPVVCVGGELDVCTAEPLRELLDETSESRPRAIIVDLTETTCIDSSGVAALMRTARRCPGLLTVVSPQDRITRFFRAVGLSESLGLRRTREEAMAALQPA